MDISEALKYNPADGTLRWINTRGGNLSGSVAGCLNVHGYVHVIFEKQCHKAHRVAWRLAYGSWPEKDLDHVNGKRDDNRLCNLREVSHRENMRNARKQRRNRSGVTGVSWVRSRSRWISTINHENSQIALTRTPDYFEAICARKSAEVKYGYHTNHGQSPV